MVSPDTTSEDREERKQQTAEVFTPPFLVIDMLDKLPKKKSWQDETSTFCDPASGNGNFLIEVLSRKINAQQKPLIALKTVYGADIMADNIREARCRLLEVIAEHGTVGPSHVHTVLKNVVWINLEQHAGGSLDYNFDFDNEPSDKDVETWLVHWKEYHTTGINRVSYLPVRAEKFVAKSEEPDIFAENEEAKKATY